MVLEIIVDIIKIIMKIVSRGNPGALLPGCLPLGRSNSSSSGALPIITWYSVVSAKWGALIDQVQGASKVHVQGNPQEVCFLSLPDGTDGHLTRIMSRPHINPIKGGNLISYSN